VPWFAVLLPDIRDDFGLNNAGALGILSANRVRIATARGAIWEVFSVATGLALTPLMLVLTRIGAGSGRAVVEPTHNSLLAD
jgi:branched-chain amino acid transport system ATP-binding protein